MMFYSVVSRAARRIAVSLLSALFLLTIATGALTAKSTSLLWKISGNGLTAPSYLYGTIHIKDKRVFEFSEAMKKALESTPSFAMEINPDSVNYMELLPMMTMNSGQSLQKLLSKEEYELVHKVLKEKLGEQAAFVERMKPVFISTLLSLEDVSSDYELALDQHLFQQAKDAKKRVYGIETAKEQMEALNSMELEDQAKMLVEVVRDEAKADSSTAAMIQAYIDADLDVLMELLHDAELESDVYEALLTRRNHTMAERIARMAKVEPVFAAIGSGHLPGDEGVIELLRKQGYTVEPVR